MSAWGRRRRERFSFFEPSRPRETRGGIKARSQRGAFGATWWAQRWIAVLEGFELGGRLQRGRSYARRGQVLDVEIDKGRVSARVQGSRPQPYRVSMRVKPLDAPAWERVAAALGRQAAFAARLLAGEMPQEIEEVFGAAGVTLFPARSADLKTECSCPDWSNPCKHIAAVYYLLGEEFDRDPFLIFRLRGMEREELLARLGPAGGAPPVEAAVPERDVAEPAAAGEPLSSGLEAFWVGGELPDVGEARPPEVAAAPLRRLGAFPFWRAERGIVEALEPAYAAAAERGQACFLGAEPEVPVEPAPTSPARRRPAARRERSRG